MLNELSVGGLTFAFGHDYQRMAYALALSLRRYGVPLTVVVPEKDQVYSKLFNECNVVFLKGRFGKFEYESLAYDLTPYDITFKFDADMIVPAEAFLLQAIPLIAKFGVVSGTACALNNRANDSTIYRRIESSMGVPTVYSAAFGFMKNHETSSRFFHKVKQLFNDWYSLKLFSKDFPPTTDTIYSIAWKCVLKHDPTEGIPFLHMKPGIAGSSLPAKWLNKVPYVLDDQGRLKLNSHTIRIPFHYHDKAFLSDAILRRLEHVYSN